MSKKVGALVSLLAAVALLWCGIAASTAADRAPETGKASVVLLHGLGRGKTAMWLLAHRLEAAGFRVERIGYRSLRDAPERILEGIGKQVAACCLGRSQTLHFVGHSLGGLLIRAYLAKAKVPNLGRVVLIGTPNRGSEIVDAYGETWWFKALGPTAGRLGTGRDGLAKTLPRPSYSLGVIAGRSSMIGNESLLPGADDGLVSVESTKVNGMADFVVVDAGHATLRYDKDVADLTIRFLNTGRFGNRPQ